MGYQWSRLSVSSISNHGPEASKLNGEAICDPRYSPRTETCRHPVLNQYIEPVHIKCFEANTRSHGLRAVL